MISKVDISNAIDNEMSETSATDEVELKSEIERVGHELENEDANVDSSKGEIALTQVQALAASLMEAGSEALTEWDSETVMFFAFVTIFSGGLALLIIPIVYGLDPTWW